MNEVADICLEQNDQSDLSERPLRVGLIGMGITGRVHFANISALKEANVVAVAEPQASNHEGVGPGIAVSEGWKSTLEDNELDAVIITLPHSMHFESAEAFLRAGKHVFLEKPLATCLVDSQRLVQCAEDAGVTFMVNMTHRFYPPLRQAKSLLAEGLIGDILTIHDHCMEVIDRSAFPAWLFDPVLAGGGVTMTESIHLLDRASWLIGERLELKGQVSRVLDPEALVEDCSELICQSENGIPVTVGSCFSFSGPRVVRDQLCILGTKGVLLVHAWSHVDFIPHGQPAQRFEGYPVDMPIADRVAVGFRAATTEFFAAIREKRVPEAAGSAVLNAHEIVQEFYDNLDRK